MHTVQKCKELNELLSSASRVSIYVHESRICTSCIRWGQSFSTFWYFVPGNALLWGPSHVCRMVNSIPTFYLVVQLVRIHLQCRRPQFDSWAGKFPWWRDRPPTPVFLGFSGGSDGKESTCNAGDVGSVPGLGRSPGEGHGDPLQYSCLENPMDGGAWRAAVHGVKKSRAWLKRRSTAFCPLDARGTQSPPRSPSSDNHRRLWRA